jgi:hypothetical protein
MCTHISYQSLPPQLDTSQHQPHPLTNIQVPEDNIFVYTVVYSVHCVTHARGGGGRLSGAGPGARLRLPRSPPARGSALHCVALLHTVAHAATAHRPLGRHPENAQIDRRRIGKGPRPGSNPISGGRTPAAPDLICPNVESDLSRFYFSGTTGRSAMAIAPLPNHFSLHRPNHFPYEAEHYKASSVEPVSPDAARRDSEEDRSRALTARGERTEKQIVFTGRPSAVHCITAQHSTAVMKCL